MLPSSVNIRQILPAYIFVLVGATSILALSQQSYVENAPQPDSFKLAATGRTAPIFVDSQDYPGVRRSIGDLQADIKRVTGLESRIVVDGTAQGTDVVIIGTLAKNRMIDALVRAGKLDAASVKGRWEAFIIRVVKDPFPGVKRALVIAGNDKRGTIYGTYDVSGQIGVSPWYWWADVPVKKRPQVFINGGTNVVDAPKVKYRGIFINDEAPALDGWVKENYGTFDHRFYAKVFELILRLKGNFLWPAMWNNAFYDDDPATGSLADEYGIVVSTSHHEPMMRAQQEWKRYGTGDWNYETNGDILRKFWREGIRRGRDQERVITLAMRGDGDTGMSRDTNISLLERIVADQRKIIAEEVNPDVTKVPQVWALYKEVQAYYEQGMRVPDDVTLLWCDDNWGNIRRLPTADEWSRAGGAGVYYHIEYVGAPRNYKWLNTVPITKIREQMDLAYRTKADHIWVANVGDIKPLEFPAEFFLDQAWDPERFTADNLDDYTRQWATREFGERHASEIADLIAAYTKYNYRRKPELLEPTTYSLVDYREAERVVEDYNSLATRAEKVYAALPAEYRDAFYQLVLYPIKACANLNELYVTVGRNRLYAVQGRASTNELSEKARALFRRDAELSHYYNNVMGGGKWRHLMDQTHIGYTRWQQPVRNAMPAVQELHIPAVSEMGIAVEGQESALPEFPRAATLPVQDIYNQTPVYFEVFNRGSVPFDFSVTTNAPWLKVSTTRGKVTDDVRVTVSVDWDLAPEGTSTGEVTITGPDAAIRTTLGPSGKKIVVKAPIFKPPFPKRGQIDGFVGANGYVSIEAEHFTKAIVPKGFSWSVLPDFGRTLSGVTLSPVLATPPSMSSGLEYKMYLFTGGEVTVDSIFAPTQNFTGGSGFRYAIAIDDEPPQVVNFHNGFDQKSWERAVSDAVRVVSTKHRVAGEGWHTLKFWAVDPDLIIEKFVVNTGGLKPNYLGPPESFRGH